MLILWLEVPFFVLARVQKFQKATYMILRYGEQHGSDFHSREGGIVLPTPDTLLMSAAALPPPLPLSP